MDKAWQPVLEDLRAGGYPAWEPAGHDNPIQVRDALYRHARTLAAAAHPELAFAHHQSDQADTAAEAATRAHQAATWNNLRLGGIDSPRTLRLAHKHDRADQHSADQARHALDELRGEIGTLTAEPVIRTLRPGRLDMERNLWQAENVIAAQTQQAARAAAYVSHDPPAVRPPAPSPGISL